MRELATEAEDRRASQGVSATGKRSRSGSRPSGTEAEDRRASQGASAAGERSRSGSRPSDNDARAGLPVHGAPVRKSAQGTWFRPLAGPGSLLRLPVGAEASTVRRLRRLGLPGLLPID